MHDGTDTLVKYIFAGDERIARVDPTAIHYYHKDHLGGPTVITNAFGIAIEAQEYLPFGDFRDHWSASGEKGSDYRYTGQEYDDSTQLYNYKARFYYPVVGRFISPDSMVQNPYDPQMLNRYSYARNNPLFFIDPTGHFIGPGDKEGFWDGYDEWGDRGLQENNGADAAGAVAVVAPATSGVFNFDNAAKTFIKNLREAIKHQLAVKVLQNLLGKMDDAGKRCQCIECTRRKYRFSRW